MNCNVSAQTLHPQCLIQHNEVSFVKDECIETAKLGEVGAPKNVKVKKVLEYLWKKYKKYHISIQKMA